MTLLKDQNIDDNTIVLFSSDNGPHKEGGHKPEFFDSNGQLKGHKRDLYEGGIRAPTIVRWTGAIPAGQVLSTMGIGHDLTATALAVAGAELDDIFIENR